MIENRKIFRQLGYQVKNNCIIFPDEKVLMARWSDLQKKSTLPDLSCISSEGIADDKSFIKSSLDGHVLLSTGCEFLHDQEIHIMQRILLCSTLEDWGDDDDDDDDPFTYDSVMNKYQNKMNRISDSIEKIEKSISKAEIENSKKEVVSFLWAYLGGMVDYASAESNLDYLYEHFLMEDTFLLGISENKEWENYMHKRFGDVYDENKANVDLAWQEIILGLNA